MNNVHTQNKFTILGNYPPLPSRLPTFAQVASSSSKDHSKEHSSPNSESMSSISPSPTIPTFSQPSQILHKYKSYQPKMFLVEPKYQHMKRELVTKVFPAGWGFYARRSK
jgi:hypothetical protein